MLKTAGSWNQTKAKTSQAQNQLLNQLLNQSRNQSLNHARIKSQSRSQIQSQIEAVPQSRHQSRNSLIFAFSLASSIVSLSISSANGPGAALQAAPAVHHAVAPVKGKPVVTQVGPNKAQCTAYLNRLRSKLMSNWFVPDGKNVVTIKVTVANDGAASDVTPSSSPQNGPAETAAMDAFGKCQPLEALPSGFTAGAKLTIVFTSTADPHGDSSSNLNLNIDPIHVDVPKAAPASAPAASQGTPATPAESTTPAEPAK